MSGAFARYAVLAVGSAVTAEFLLGDQYLSGGSPAVSVCHIPGYNLKALSVLDADS